MLFAVQKALPLLTDGASIVLTLSTTSVQATANFNVYSASKAAVRNFARSWPPDLKNRHIRVNAVSPGPIRTPGLGDLAPLGRLGEPSEIGKVVAFLASDAASYTNGIELFVDGGMAQGLAPSQPDPAVETADGVGFDPDIGDPPAAVSRT